MFHAPLIAATAGLKLAVIVTADRQRAGQARAEHPRAAVVDTVDVVFDPGRVDVVVVAAPNGAHVVLARRAVEAGIPVVVDKPLAASWEQAAALVEAAARAEVAVSVFHNRRWDGDFLTVRRLLDEGRLGQVHRFESRLERWRPQVDRSRWREDPDPTRGGGLLLDLGSHLIDQALVLFGPVSAVYAELGVRRRAAVVDDDVFVALAHTSGVHSHLWAGALVADPGPRFRVLGQSGAYRVGGVDVQESQLRAGRRPGQPGWAAADPATWGTIGTPGSSQPVPTLPGRYQVFYEQLAASLDGTGPPPVPAEQGLAVLQVVDAARRAARQRSVVELHSSP